METSQSRLRAALNPSALILLFPELLGSSSCSKSMDGRGGHKKPALCGEIPHLNTQGGHINPALCGENGEKFHI